MTGENLASGASLARTPRVLMDGWLHSTGRRENPFRSEWRKQGLALVEAETFLDSGPAAIYVHQFGRLTSCVRRSPRYQFVTHECVPIAVRPSQHGGSNQRLCLTKLHAMVCQAMVKQRTFEAVHLTLHGTASAELGETGEELNDLLHQALLTFESASETESFFRTLRRSLQSAVRPEQSDAVASFLKDIVSDDEAADHQQGMKFVAEGLARDFERRKQLLAKTLGVKEVEELLGLKRQSVNERWKKGQLFGLLTANAVRFPTWQFDPDAEKGVLPGLDKVLAALGQSHLSPLNQAYWLTSPKPQFDGRTPVEALKDGMIDEVASWAYGAGVT